jgi:methionine aminopeptidase
VLTEGDVVTVSLGVHIDGYAVLSSQTIRIQASPSPTTGPIADATCALHYAINGIINILSKGTVSQLELVLQDALETFGVHVVEGSCLRRIRRFLAGQTTIQERHSKVLEFGEPVMEEWGVAPGEVYLLDLAISTGPGKVKVHSDLRPTIYTRSIPNSQNHANFKLMATRALFTQLISNSLLYSVFPFTLRQNPDPSRARLGIAELVTRGVLHPCPIIVEKAPNAVVVRRTVTIYVRNQGEVVILGGGDQEAKIMWVRSEKGAKAGSELERAVKSEGVKVVELKKVEGERMEIE